METPEKITIPVTSTVTEEKEITLPVYRKSSCFVWKVVNDKNAICVTFTHPVEISECTPSSAFNPGIKIFDCSEDEFMEHYHEVQERLNALVK